MNKPRAILFKPIYKIVINDDRADALKILPVRRPPPRRRKDKRSSMKSKQPEEKPIPIINLVHDQPNVDVGTYSTDFDILSSPSSPSDEEDLQFECNVQEDFPFFELESIYDDDFSSITDGF